MRVVTVIGVLLVGGAATVSAQHAHQIEFGGFGSYTRYDRSFGLADQFGGGGRLGYFFNETFSLEVDGNVAYPTPTVGGMHVQTRYGSASLLLNSGGQRNILYLLGGYTYLDNGVNPPYNFKLNAAHAGIGDRIFLFGDRLALRLEARGYYGLKDSPFDAKPVLHVLGSAGLSYFLLGGGPRAATPPPIPKARRDSILAAGGKVPEREPERPRAVGGGGGGGGGPTYERRTGDWPHKWYWGAQGGMFVFRTNYEGLSFEPMFGGHWLITGKRTAAYVAYEQSVFLTDKQTTFVAPDGTTADVFFKDLRRLMMGVLAFPAQQRVEPFGGAGFALMQALNVEASCGTCTAAQFAAFGDAAADAASKAFVFVMGGIDIKQGRLALYGHYILTSSARGFILDGTTHTIQGGIRYSVGSAKEDLNGR
ncbi:MAG TPA: hypothetical protein VEK78_09635 [Gemmatimonadales bacterium]|nr:hypothetical protein [Gemmatimonadales bacterium]HYT84444.1 hypothetical protein [Gemmatimonadales bacterium]